MGPLTLARPVPPYLLYFNSQETLKMKLGRFATMMQYSLLAALVVMSVCSSRAQAQDDHSHAMNHKSDVPAAQESAILTAVRNATSRFQSITQASHEGYKNEFGCVSGGDFGAMGIHFVNDALVGNGVIDLEKPQIILYEALPNGGAKITGADYLVLADAWDAKHPGVTPELMGQHFHYFETPNRFGLPAFYTLHVWAWKENPNGAFSNWNPNVSCEFFVGQTTP